MSAERYDKDKEKLALATTLAGRTIVLATVFEKGSEAGVWLYLDDNRIIKISAQGSLHDECYLCFNKISPDESCGTKPGAAQAAEAV